MYILTREGLGEDTTSRPTTLAMRPRPDVILDKFKFNEFTLNVHPQVDHPSLIRTLARTIVITLGTSRPISRIRLVGHTDSTGTEKYNVGLGKQRAETVKDELDKEIHRLHPNARINIVVDRSPGETQPIADNRTPAGRDRNRRVEFFVTKSVVPRVDWTKLPPEVIKRIEEQAKRDSLLKPSPPSKANDQSSFDKLMDKLMDKHKIPSSLRSPLKAAVRKGLRSLLDDVIFK